MIDRDPPRVYADSIGPPPGWFVDKAIRAWLFLWGLSHKTTSRWLAHYARWWR